MSSEYIVTDVTEPLKPVSSSAPSSNSSHPFTNFETGYTNKTELEKLIEIIKKGIRDKEEGIKVIRYPELLVQSLQELNDMIGLEKIKESAAIQTVHLIENLKTGRKNMSMLNTILSGSPGVGKTTCAIKLAKIWFALGFLGGSTETKTTTTTTTSKGYVPSVVSTPSMSDYTGVLFLFGAWVGVYALQLLSYLYDNLSLYYLGMCLSFLVLLVFLWWYSGMTTETVSQYFSTKNTEVRRETTSSDRDIVTVVSRVDFMGEYMGHTAAKTKRLLDANIGKVLFIDEAYTLFNDPRDAYGREAIDTINLFLSENPDKIVIIFAGYYEQLKSTIFAVQPGLERRVMWTFKCNPYTGEQLSQIFTIQAAKADWVLADHDKIRIKRLIVQNASEFKAYGGDTEKLVYLSGLEEGRDSLSNLSETLFTMSSDGDKKKTGPSKKYLTFAHVERGLATFRENSHF